MKSSNGTRHRRRQSARRYFRNGHRAAAVRALTALVINGAAPTISAAAERCSSCAPYVQAAIALLRSENKALLADVINHEVTKGRRSPDLVLPRASRSLTALRNRSPRRGKERGKENSHGYAQV